MLINNKVQILIHLIFQQQKISDYSNLPFLCFVFMVEMLIKVSIKMTVCRQQWTLVAQKHVASDKG